MLGFAYRLALKLGIKDGKVWDWLEDLPWPEFQGWMMFEEVDGPWGSRRDELVTAISGETIINELRLLNYHVAVYMAGKKAREVPKPELLKSGDLLPRFGQQEQEQEQAVTGKKTKSRTRGKKIARSSEQQNQQVQQQDTYYQLWLADKEARKRLLEQQSANNKQSSHSHSRKN